MQSYEITLYYLMGSLLHLRIMHIIHSVERGESFKPYFKAMGYTSHLQCVFLVVVNKLSQARHFKFHLCMKLHILSPHKCRIYTHHTSSSYISLDHKTYVSSEFLGLNLTTYTYVYARTLVAFHHHMPLLL